MPVSNETLSLLAKLVGGINTTPQPPQANLARQILLRSQIDWGAANMAPTKVNNGGPSVVSRIFDLLSRPNYAVATHGMRSIKDIAEGNYGKAIGDALNPVTMFEDAWSGLSGKKKTTFTNSFLHDKELNTKTGMGDQPSWVKALLGLTLDIGLDPTTYIGPGAVKGIFKGAKAVSTLAKGAEVVDKVEQAASPVMKIGEAATTAKPIGAALPQVAMDTSKIKYAPGVLDNLNADVKVAGSKLPKPGPPPSFGRAADLAAAATHTAPPLAADASKVPQFYAQVQRASQLMDRIAEGSPQAARTVAPKPPVGNLALTDAQKTAAATKTATVLEALPDKSSMGIKAQLILFKNLLKDTSGAPLDRFSQAVGMLKHSEQMLEHQGVTLVYHDGTGIKLSNIFDELGGVERITPQILKEIETGRVINPALDQAVENLRVRSAMADAPMVQLGLGQTTQQAARVSATTSPARAESILRGLPAELRTGMRAAHVSPAAQKTGNAVLTDILRSQAGAPQSAMTATQKTAHAIMNAKATKQAMISRQVKINKAIEKHMNSSYRVVATKLGDRNQAVEYLGIRFAAHYGYADLRPTAQDFMLSAEANAGRRHKLWSGVARATTREQRAESFRAATMVSRPGFLPPADQGAMDLGLQMRDSIERLFSSTGIKDTAQSVATRAAFTMEDINAELRRIGSDFQFTKDKVEDQFGNLLDYSKNVDWLKSWEMHVLGPKEDAIEFISKLETAAEKVSKRYALLDEAGARFGSSVRTGVYQHLAADPRMAGMYFPKDTVVQINRMNEALKGAYGAPNSAFIKMVDRATSTWKSGVTIYAPSHHIRNLIGDVWLSWIAGVNNPKRYTAAAAVLKSQHGRYQGSIAELEKLIDPNALAKAPTGGRTVVTTRGGRQFTADQVYVAAHQRGLLLGARSIEDIYGEALMPKIFGGHVQDFARGSAELREHYVRLAHFIDAIAKSKAGTVKETLDQAAHVVRKWHPDGMDLTDFERRYMRRVFPFYSWTRKAFPLVLEAMVMKPGKVVAYPKVMEAVQGAMGIDATRADPFPSDQLFPSWIKEKGIGPIAQTGAGGLSGFIASLSRQGVDANGKSVGGYSMLNPSNPMVDLLSTFGGAGNPRAPLQGIGSMLNPLAKIPIEVTTDKQLFTDVPVSYDPARYATEQLPGGGILSRMTNLGIGGPTVRGQREGIGNKEAIINYLTAAGLQGTGPYIGQAKTEARKRGSGDRQKAIDDFMKRYANGG